MDFNFIYRDWKKEALAVNLGTHLIYITHFQILAVVAVGFSRKIANNSLFVDF